MKAITEIKSIEDVRFIMQSIDVLIPSLIYINIEIGNKEEFDKIIKNIDDVLIKNGRVLATPFPTVFYGEWNDEGTIGTSFYIDGKIISFHHTKKSV